MELETTDTPALPSEIVTEEIFKYLSPTKLNSLAESTGELQSIAQGIIDNYIKNKAVKVLKDIFYGGDRVLSDYLMYYYLSPLIKFFKNTNYSALNYVLIRFYKEVIVVNLKNPNKKYRRRAYEFKRDFKQNWRVKSLKNIKNDVETLKEIYGKGAIKELDSTIKSFVEYRQKFTLKVFYEKVIKNNFLASDVKDRKGLKEDCYGRNILQWRVICHQKFAKDTKEKDTKEVIAKEVIAKNKSDNIRSLFKLAFDFKNYEFIESIAETMASKYGKNELAKILIFGDLCIKYNPNKECDNESMVFYRKKIRNYIKVKYKNNKKSIKKTHSKIIEDFRNCNKTNKFPNTPLAGILNNELNELERFHNHEKYKHLFEEKKAEPVEAKAIVIKERSKEWIYSSNPIKRFIGKVFDVLSAIKLHVKVTISLRAEKKRKKRRQYLQKSIYKGKNPHAMTKEQRKEYKSSVVTIFNLLHLPAKKMLSKVKKLNKKEKADNEENRQLKEAIILSNAEHKKLKENTENTAFCKNKSRI